MDKTKFTYSFISAADLSDKVGYAVKLDGTLGFNNQPKVNLAGAGDVVIGIIYDGGRQSGDEVTVVLAGICEGYCGDTVVVGNLLKAEAGGGLVPAANTTDEQVCAIALGSGADGEKVAVLIRHMSV